MPSGQATYVVETKIKVNGSLLPSAIYGDLADLRVEQALDVPDQATLRFFDPDLELANGSSFAIGDALVIDITNTGGTTASILSGEITAVTIETGPGGIFELVVTALAKTHRLARAVRVRTFADQTDSDIVSQIAQEEGLSVEADSTTITHPYVLQAESNYAFLTRRALALGYRWWVEDRTLKFKKVAEPAEGASYDRDQLISLRLRMSSIDAASEVTVRGWDPAQQRAVVATATPSTGLGEGFGSDGAAASGVPGKAAAFAAGKRFASGSLGDQSSAQAYADAIGRKVSSAHVSVRGVVDGNPDLRPGNTVTINGLGTQLSGKFAVTAVEHVLGAESGYLSRFKCQGIGGADLVDLLAPPSASGSFPGLMVGIVTNLEDPDGHGRVKVKFPTLADDDESAWARLALPGAGPQRGLQLMPEINDEVLVGFEQGDPSHPVVLGGLWSARNAPPLASSAAVKSSAVVSRVLHTTAGHKIEIHEESGANKILISLAGDKGSITMEDAAIAVVSTGDISVTADGAVTVKATKDLTLEGQNVTIKATNKVNVQGVEVGVKGTAKAAIQAAQTEIKADATLTLSAGAMAELKGAMVKLN